MPGAKRASPLGRFDVLRSGPRRFARRRCRPSGRPALRVASGAVADRHRVRGRAERHLAATGMELGHRAGNLRLGGGTDEAGSPLAHEGPEHAADLPADLRSGEGRRVRPDPAPALEAVSSGWTIVGLLMRV